MNLSEHHTGHTMMMDIKSAPKKARTQNLIRAGRAQKAFRERWDFSGAYKDQSMEGTSQSGGGGGMFQ